MKYSFETLSMMDLRSAPGEALDRVSKGGEAFVIERNGQQMACLVPLSMFMPDIQPARIAKEFELLQQQKEKHSTSITDSYEVELMFRGEGPQRNLNVTIRLPHGYPSTCPKVFVEPLPEHCPQRWRDNSLRIFGAMALWSPKDHDVTTVLNLTRRWLADFASWQESGVWRSDAG